jgi:hypothetical protein
MPLVSFHNQSSLLVTLTVLAGAQRTHTHMQDTFGFIAWSIVAIGHTDSSCLCTTYTHTCTHTHIHTHTCKHTHTLFHTLSLFQDRSLSTMLSLFMPEVKLDSQVCACVRVCVRPCVCVYVCVRVCVCCVCAEPYLLYLIHVLHAIFSCASCVFVVCFLYSTHVLYSCMPDCCASVFSCTNILTYVHCVVWFLTKHSGKKA